MSLFDAAVDLNPHQNLKVPDDTWKVLLIEEDFQRLMFDTEGE
jgi:adenine-specific DNA-methyltransferase